LTISAADSGTSAGATDWALAFGADTAISTATTIIVRSTAPTAPHAQRIDTTSLLFLSSTSTNRRRLTIAARAFDPKTFTRAAELSTVGCRRPGHYRASQCAPLPTSAFLLTFAPCIVALSAFDCDSHGAAVAGHLYACPILRHLPPAERRISLSAQMRRWQQLLLLGGVRVDANIRISAVKRKPALLVLDYARCNQEKTLIGDVILSSVAIAIRTTFPVLPPIAYWNYEDEDEHCCGPHGRWPCRVPGSRAQEAARRPRQSRSHRRIYV
jgi:hypothetical protein